MTDHFVDMRRMQGAATGSRMLGELVPEGRHPSIVLTHKLVATVPEQQGSIQSESSQAAMLRLFGMLGSSQHQSEQSDCQQFAWDNGSSCEASQQVIFAMCTAMLSSLPCV